MQGSSNDEQFSFMHLFNDLILLLRFILNLVGVSHSFLEPHVDNLDILKGHNLLVRTIDLNVPINMMPEVLSNTIVSLFGVL